MRVKSIMDINEVTTRQNKDVKNPSQVDGFFQVQFYLTMKWFESRLKFQVIFSNHHWTRQASNTFHYIFLPWIIPIKESNQISFFFRTWRTTSTWTASCRVRSRKSGLPSSSLKIQWGKKRFTMSPFLWAFLWALLWGHPWKYGEGKITLLWNLQKVKVCQGH